MNMIVDSGTGGVYTLCIRGRNNSNSQEPESEARVTKRGRKAKYNKGKKYPRKNNPVVYSKNDKFHKKSPITLEPIPGNSQNILFSSHKVTYMS